MLARMRSVWRWTEAVVCLYAMTQSQRAIRELTRAMQDRTGNLPPLPGIFPDYKAPIVRNQREGRELTMARWGMPERVNDFETILGLV